MDTQKKISTSAFLLLFGFLSVGTAFLVTDISDFWQFVAFSITAFCWELEAYLSLKWGTRDSAGLVSYEDHPVLHRISELVWHGLILALPCSAFVQMMVNQ